MKIHDMPKVDKQFDKVEMYWGNTHDVINTKTRKCVATFWTIDKARKESEYFPEYVGVDLDTLDFRRGSVHVKKAKDAVLDVIVNVKRFNRSIFNRVVAGVLGKDMTI